MPAGSHGCGPTKMMRWAISFTARTVAGHSTMTAGMPYRTRSEFTLPMSALCQANTSQSRKAARRTPTAFRWCRIFEDPKHVGFGAADRGASKGGFRISQFEPHDTNSCVGRVGLDIETEISAHLQHDCVFGKHVTGDHLEPLGLGIFDH